MNHCLYCQKETKNPYYCSNVCSGFNNKNESNKPVHKCKGCGKILTFIKKRILKYCEDCKERSPNYKDWRKITLADMFSRLSTHQAHARIRSLGRYSYLKDKRPTFCYFCGYDKHVEVCYIKPIKDFNPQTSIAEVNSPDNLIGLCPNCHWEFDNHLISLN